MSQKGDERGRDVLAMARGKSPWGDSKSGDSDPTEGSGTAEATDGEVREDDPRSDAPVNNPWLPTPGASQPDKRRSARIDDILRSRRGQGSNGGLPPLPGGDKARVVLPWVIAGSAVLLALSTSFQMIEQGQSAIVTKLGRYSRTLGPGLHLTMPWPIEVVHLQSGAEGTTLNLPDEGGEMQLLTGDGELIDLAFVVRWAVTDGRKYSSALADPDATLRALALAEMRTGVAEVSFDGLWQGSAQPELQRRVAGRMQRALDAMRAGIHIDGVEVIRANPPDRLTEAFKKQTLAREEADRVRKQAEQWADQTMANARSEAAAFDKVYAQYKLAPRVIRSRMYYETMERVLRNNSKVVIGSSQPSVPATGAKQP